MARLTLDRGFGAATLGSIGFLVTWLWLLYRVIRAMLQLADSKPVA